MGDITPPFTRWKGSLKRINRDLLSAHAYELFDRCFPRFFDKSDSTSAGAWDEFASMLAPLVEVHVEEGNPRRYGGLSLRRGGYYALIDSKGGDEQTLAHELRAYRNPFLTESIECFDLASVPGVQIGETLVPLTCENALAVLLRKIELAPPALRDALRRLPDQDGLPLWLFRVPYEVAERTIDKVIDLRLPETREWFFQQFAEPDKANEALRRSPFASQVFEPTIAYSRFHFESGNAPPPKDFWEMLPTLLNPDLGGGSLDVAGSSLFVVAHWLRSHGVNALIYPSARCDVEVEIVRSELRSFRGWNLVSYEGAVLTDNVVFAPSPWAWMRLPQGVTIQVTQAGSYQHGSFRVQGMVNYWARDHLNHVHGLRLLGRLYGEGAAKRRPPDPFACWLIGLGTMRWARMVVARAPREKIDEAILELVGHSHAVGLFDFAGRVQEQWVDALQGQKVDPADSIKAAYVMSANLRERTGSPALGRLLQIAAEFEMLLLTLAGRLRGVQPETGFWGLESRLLEEIKVMGNEQNQQEHAFALGRLVRDIVDRSSVDAEQGVAWITEGVELTSRLREAFAPGSSEGSR